MSNLAVLSSLLLAAVSVKAEIVSSWNVSNVQANDWKSIATSGGGWLTWAASSQLGDLGLWRSIDYGKTFQNIAINGGGSPNRWVSVVASTTGVFYALQEGVGLFYSTNSGTYENGGFWEFREIDHSLKGQDPKWAAVATSATGQAVAVALTGGGLYTSRDYGSNFVHGKGLPTESADKQWTAIAMSAKSDLLVAAHVDTVALSPALYISSDYGANWVLNKAAPPLHWTSLSFSSKFDTQYLFAAAAFDNASGSIYRTSDLGKNWYLVKDTAHPYLWKSVVADSTGSNFVSVVTGSKNIQYGTVYYSDNRGATVTTSTSAPFNETWSALSASADYDKDYGFKYVFATTGGKNGKIYYTTHYQ